MFTELSWIGLDWVIKLLEWVGVDLAKWIHVQLCSSRRALSWLLIISCPLSIGG